MNGRIPYFISEHQAYLRGIKSGWYVMDESGNLSFRRVRAGKNDSPR
jgi:hypothetical protein